MKKCIFIVCILSLIAAETNGRTPVSTQPQSQFLQYTKNAVQNAAGLTALGAIGYGGYQLCQTIRYWFTENDGGNKTNESMAKFLLAVIVAGGAGTLATADLSTVNFNIHFDIVRAIELLLKRRS